MIIELSSSSGHRVGIILNKIIAIIENKAPTNTPVKVLLDNNAFDVRDSYEFVRDKITKALMVYNEET